MPIPDSQYSTLANIQTKVRLLTRSLSENQLTTAQLNNYINTFVLYDFPEQLRLFNLKRTFAFYTQPYVDFYSTNLTDPTNPLYNFVNQYISVHSPVFIAGYQALFLESQEQFYSIYPKVANISSIGVYGNGLTTQFTGVINSQQNVNLNPPANTPQTVVLLGENVLFSSVDVNNNGLAKIDYPINNYIGNLYTPGGSPTSTSVQDVNNYINYLTGQYTVTFATAPQAGLPINSQVVPVQCSLPQTMLFFNGSFTLRPVPDQPYKVEFDVYVRPTQLLQSTDMPNLCEWWQYIAYGAAKKIFEDRMDLESVQMILPEFNMQQRLILRRTIVQQTSQRVATIYSQNNGSAGAYGPGWFSGGGSF